MMCAHKDIENIEVPWIGTAGQGGECTSDGRMMGGGKETVGGMKI